MHWKKYLLCLLNVGVSACALAQTSVAMNKMRLQWNLTKNGTPEYAVFFNGKTVIEPSKLGFNFNDGTKLDKDFQVLKMDSSTTNETWKPVWGEVNTIRNHYKQLTVHLQQKNAPNALLNIVFKVFEDGVGFRYEFPVQPALHYFIISDELTQFNLAGDPTAWWIPGDYDSNEYLYTTSKLSQVNSSKIALLSYGDRKENLPDEKAVQTPLMLKTTDGLYINLHEAAQVNYPAMQLHVDGGNHSLEASLVPDAYGNKAYLLTPTHTPWRTIIVSDKAADILASKMILNLNEPTKIQNTAWIKPMKFMGIWWEMQTGRGTWNYADREDTFDVKGHLIPHGKHSANTANVKKYIDFAAKHNIKGLLVEGWNTGWEAWYGNWQGRHFDFVTPYPDFDVTVIQQYAKSKGVQMIMHNETSADASTYDQQLDTAFRFMNRYGYTSVKTGYVGRIIPRGEHHDGQFLSNHYVRAAEKAAQYKVTIDMHEPVRPTGLQRTYPNWLANEAGRGNEWNGFADGNPPEHETIMPFTRLMGGPMDYTPGIFKMKGYAVGVPERQMHTTLTKQLALYITLYSPLQMAADLPENYDAHLDAFRFIEDVPVDWDDTKILEAEPGDYLTIARKEKGKAAWYMGAITDENSRTTTLPLSFLDKNKNYMATIYRDADNADWKDNPEAYTIEKFIVTNATQLQLKLAPGGGTAIQFVPATATQAKILKMYP